MNTNTDLKTLANQLVTLFPGSNLNMSHDHCFSIKFSGGEVEGMGFYFRKEYTGKRIEISCVWPKDKKNHTFTPGNYIWKDGVSASSPEITVSADKTAEKIHKDISSRLWPEYAKLFVELKKRVESSNSYMDKFDTSRKELGAIFNKEINQDYSRVELYAKVSIFGEEKTIDVQMNGPESINLNIRDLNVNQVRKIMEVLLNS